MMFSGKHIFTLFKILSHIKYPILVFLVTISPRSKMGYNKK